jgi:hypothetical protein
LKVSSRAWWVAEKETIVNKHANEPKTATQLLWARASALETWAELLLLLLGGIAITAATLLSLVVMLCMLPLQVLTGGRGVYRLPPRPRWQPRTGAQASADSGSAGPRLIA